MVPPTRTLEQQLGGVGDASVRQANAGSSVEIHAAEVLIGEVDAAGISMARTHLKEKLSCWTRAAHRPTSGKRLRVVLCVHVRQLLRVALVPLASTQLWPRAAGAALMWCHQCERAGASFSMSCVATAAARGWRRRRRPS